jgi:hypothetical protein
MDIALHTDAARPKRRRYTFLRKAVLTAILVTLADRLFFGVLFLPPFGSTLGIFAAALLVALLAATPAIGRSRAALAASAAAFVYALALGDDPSLLGWTLFWTAATLAALLPRTSGFDDALRWALRLLIHAPASLFAPFMDLRRARKVARAKAHGRRPGVPLGLVAVPALGSLLFVSLFAAANPLISRTLSRFDFGDLLDPLTVLRMLFWIPVLLLVWGLLKPPRYALAAATQRQAIELPGFSPASVALSLIAFNAVFALQNGLDLAFLWSGAGLPDGVGFAEYAHRGAYPLIATALLAALFVLVALRSGSATAASVPIRRLVYLWIGQNVLLVASTMLRTLDYVEAYSLTRLRIAALLWMALVAVGLLLICYRLWRGKSGSWLINANSAAAALALTFCAFADLGTVAAQWNVRHAREVGGRGAAIDLCYLGRLGPSALLPMLELEKRRLAPEMRDRAAAVRTRIMSETEAYQSDWHSWTFRNQRRLGEARRMAAAHPLQRIEPNDRDCDGRRAAPGPPVAPGKAKAGQ